YAIAVQSYPLLEKDTRDVYEGFAAGVNRFIEVNADMFPEGFVPQFTGYDVAARDVNVNRASQARQFVSRMIAAQRGEDTAAEGEGAEGDPLPEGQDAIEEGSNAWAFAPTRTTSGNAVLVRNPHLSWTAGYY